MALRISHFTYSVALLLFVISGIGFIIDNTDNIEGVSSGIANTGFSSLKDNLTGKGETEGLSYLEKEFIKKIDETSSFSTEEAQDVDTRGEEGLGIIDILGKNIIVKFFKQLKTDLGIVDTGNGKGGIIFLMITTLLGFSIAFMFLKAVREKKT